MRSSPTEPNIVQLGTRCGKSARESAWEPGTQWLSGLAPPAASAHGGQAGPRAARAWPRERATAGGPRAATRARGGHAPRLELGLRSSSSWQAAGRRARAGLVPSGSCDGTRQPRGIQLGSTLDFRGARRWEMDRVWGKLDKDMVWRRV
jgi:hypothetical protein